MNLIATIGEREVTVAVKANGGSNYEVTIDGARIIVNARRVAHHLWSLLCGNKTVEVDVFRLPGEEFEVMLNGDRHKFSLMNEQRKAMLRAGGTGSAGRVMITSPMPGKIVKLLVDVGQEVEGDHGLIVVEAMKMENELKSTGAGKVSEIFVKEGDVVESGAKLLLIE